MALYERETKGNASALKPYSIYYSCSTTNVAIRRFAAKKRYQISSSLVSYLFVGNFISTCNPMLLLITHLALQSNRWQHVWRVYVWIEMTSKSSKSSEEALSVKYAWYECGKPIIYTPWKYSINGKCWKEQKPLVFKYEIDCFYASLLMIRLAILLGNYLICGLT